MKRKRKRLKKKTRILLVICASMIVAAALFFGAWQYLAHLLDTQQAAERWEGEGELNFKQITCFLPADQTIVLKDITTFRTAAVKAMQDAALDTAENPHLMVDGWSTTAKLYTSGEHGRGEASVIAVGGDYFDFHPLRLLSGDYIQQSDLMKDRIVLSEEVAWLLFGGALRRHGRGRHVDEAQRHALCHRGRGGAGERFLQQKVEQRRAGPLHEL